MSSAPKTYEQIAIAARRGDCALYRVNRVRYGGVAAIVGALLWLACLVNVGTGYRFLAEDAAQFVIMNPALACLALGLYAFRTLEGKRSGRLGTVGYVWTLLAIAGMLAGSLLEYGLGDFFYDDVPGAFEPTDHWGWILFGSGMITTCIGLMIFGFAMVRDGVLRLWIRLTPLVFGAITLLLLAQGLVIISITKFDEQETILIMSMAIFGVGWFVIGVAVRAGLRHEDALS